MCFGRNWDPQTKYNARYRADGSEAPPIPDKLVSLVKTSIKDSQAYDSSIPSMNPDICIVNFYATSGRLGLHKVSLFLLTLTYKHASSRDNKFS